MIVYSRGRNDGIVINHDIIVTVVDIRGERVRLGIEFPPGVPVHRHEVWEAIQSQRAELPPPPSEEEKG